MDRSKKIRGLSEEAKEIILFHGRRNRTVFTENVPKALSQEVLNNKPLFQNGTVGQISRHHTGVE